MSAANLRHAVHGPAGDYVRMLTRYVDQTTGEPHNISAAAWSLWETCRIDAVWHGAPNCESDEEEW